MKTSKSSICCLLAIVLLVSLPLYAVHADPSPQKRSHKKVAVQSVKWPQTCPVSGEKIASVKDAVGSTVYEGKTYYFCCSMCKPIFDKDPAKYSTAAAKGKYLTPM